MAKAERGEGFNRQEARVIRPALTFEQHRELMKGRSRPITDHPIGSFPRPGVFGRNSGPLREDEFRLRTVKGEKSSKTDKATGQ